MEASAVSRRHIQPLRDLSPPVSSPASTASLSSVPSVPVTPTTRPLSRQTPLASAVTAGFISVVREYAQRPFFPRFLSSGSYNHSYSCFTNHSIHLARCALVAQAATKGGSCKNATRDQDFGHRSEEEPLSDTSSEDDISPQ